MEFSLLERIVFAFKFNSSLVHNISLAVIYLLLLVKAFFFLKKVITWIIAKLKNDAENPTSSHLNLLPLGIGGLGLIFPIFMFVILTVSLDGAGRYDVIDQLITQDDEKVGTAISIYEKFTANETGKMTFGTSNMYISGHSISNPKNNWQKKIANGSESNSRIIGEVGKNVYFYSGNEIQGVTKKTGKEVLSKKKIVAKNPELTNLIGTNHQGIHLAKAENSLYFETNQGDWYQLDLTSLKAKKASDDYAGMEQEVEKKELSQQVLTGSLKSISNNYSFLSFMSDDIIKKIKEIAEFNIAFNEKDRWTTRKVMHLYGFGASNTTSSLSFTKLSNQKLISPNFLTEETHEPVNQYNLTKKNLVEEEDSWVLDENSELIVEVPKDDFFGSMVGSIVRSQVYSAVDRTPILMDDKYVLLKHYQSLDEGSPILISKFDLESLKTIWTINTGASYFKNYIQEGSNLFINPKANGGSSQLLIIDCNQGTGKGYDFKYDYVFPIKNEAS